MARLYALWFQATPSQAPCQASSLSIGEEIIFTLTSAQHKGSMEELDHNWWEIQYYDGGFTHDDFFDFGDRFEMAPETPAA